MYMCLGFVFSVATDNVLLIHKTKPPFQYGKLNGIGGKVEKGETPQQAMVRECKEESGITVSDWLSVCILDYNNDRVYVYTSWVKDLDSITDQPGENKLYVLSTPLKPSDPVVPNLHWMVPLSQTVLKYVNWLKEKHDSIRVIFPEELV